MNYQQSQFAPQGRSRVNLPRRLDLTDPALVAANQQSSLTQEQLEMLSRRKYSFFGGCLLLSFGVLFGLLITGVELAALFQGQLTLVSLNSYITPLVMIAIGWLWAALRSSGRKRFKESVMMAGNYFSMEQAQGEVIWRDRRYEARIPGRGSLRVDGMRLLPGPYHFYYAREGRIVLSAQPIHTHTQSQPGMLSMTGLSGDEQARLSIQQALYEVLHFTQADLAANHQGFATDRQLRRLFLWSRHKQPFVVQSTQGEITTSSKSEGDDVLYYYEVNGLLIQLDSDYRSEQVLVKGIPYRVYYLMPRKPPARLLSIEPLQAPAR